MMMFIKKSLEVCILVNIRRFYCSVVVVCHGHDRRQVIQASRCRGSLMHESVSPDSAIDPLVTSQSGVCC